MKRDEASSTLIKGATLIEGEGRRIADLRIASGRIDQIAEKISPRAGDLVVDGEGKWLLPGMIDVHVHFREPGLESKADMESESRAAAAGGVTSVMEMPNTLPQTVTLERVREKFLLASKKCAVNHSFYLGATNDNIDETLKANPEEICGVKLFMGASTGNLLVEKDSSLRRIFADSPLLIAAHCEDTPTIKRAEEEAKKKYGAAVPFELHAEIRSAEACFHSSSLAVELANEYHARLHLLHITTLQELSLLSDLPLEKKRITAEVCIPHLWFEKSSYELLGGRLKCNPAVKSLEDRNALRRALKTGLIDLLATDHAPHTFQEKSGSYFDAPSGLPSIQEALSLALELAAKGHWSAEMVVQRYAHAPAQLFGIQERGFLREGYWADLVLVEPMALHQVEASALLSKCGWSPWEGEMLHHQIEKSWVNGSLAWNAEEPKKRYPVASKALRFSNNRR